MHASQRASFSRNTSFIKPAVSQKALSSIENHHCILVGKSHQQFTNKYTEALQVLWKGEVVAEDNPWVLHLHYCSQLSWLSVQIWNHHHLKADGTHYISLSHITSEYAGECHRECQACFLCSGVRQNINLGFFIAWNEVLGLRPQRAELDFGKTVWTLSFQNSLNSVVSTTVRTWQAQWQVYYSKCCQYMFLHYGSLTTRQQCAELSALYRMPLQITESIWRLWVTVSSKSDFRNLMHVTHSCEDLASCCVANWKNRSCST